MPEVEISLAGRFPDSRQASHDGSSPSWQLMKKLSLGGGSRERRNWIANDILRYKGYLSPLEHC